MIVAIDYSGLFELLDSRKLSLTQMTKELRLSTATVAKFGRDEYVSLKTIEAISRYFNVTIDEIIRFKNTKPPFYLYARLLEEMNHRIKGGLYHETQILLTFNSNHIEGSRLSYEQTRYIFETNTISGDEKSVVNIDDIVEATNHFRCIDYMIKTALEPLSEMLIKDLHKILKTGTSDAKLDWFAVGDYKKLPNAVGGNETTQPKNVAKAMADLIAKYEHNRLQSFEDIIAFHYQFESIHPFQDGNGRVGRLIAFKECLRHGYIPFTIDEDLKLFYYRGLNKWPEQRGYLLDTCLTGQDKYSQLLNTLGIKKPTTNG
ncbi:MAG TPA: Fic family protein [Bacilli bacterium]|nr:Fic family protein [Bacilli bacterium]